MAGPQEAKNIQNDGNSAETEGLWPGGPVAAREGARVQTRADRAGEAAEQRALRQSDFPSRLEHESQSIDSRHEEHADKHAAVGREPAGGATAASAREPAPASSGHRAPDLPVRGEEGLCPSAVHLNNRLITEMATAPL